MSKHLQRLIGWIGAFAILMAALAPALSHALSSGDDSASNWQSLCSSSAKAGDDSFDSNGSPVTPAKNGLDHFFEHCPFCTTHVDALTIWPKPLVVLKLSKHGNFQPLLFMQARRTLFAWATPLSRAPPAIS